MSSKKILISGFIAFSFGLFQYAQAALKPSLQHEVPGQKQNEYFRDGFFLGGHASVSASVLKDIRFGRAKSAQASHEHYERLVFDLSSDSASSHGDVASSQKSLPYFHVQTAPKEGRLLVSIWGDVSFDFDKAKIQKAFKKSAQIKHVNVFPRVEDELATIEVMLKNKKNGKSPKIEVFHLANPSRVIVDIL